MKTIYNICYIVCALQLLLWIFMMIIEKGFYVNSAPYSRDYTLAEKVGLTDSSFNMINRMIALWYFSALVFVVSSIFFWKGSDKKYVLIICLTIFTLCIWLVFPLLLGKIG